MTRKKNAVSIPVSNIKHKAKRANIPTEELRGFVADDERNPKTILYPRDPSLDPQLVWRGKDEQDSNDLAVPAVPVYIQEKIHPQAIVENVRAEIDESTWQTLYSTTSASFPTPRTGKIAIKVINHYGDEVLKVFAVN